MLSRILRAEKSSEALKVVWPTAGAAAPDPAAASPADPARPKGKAAVHEALDRNAQEAETARRARDAHQAGYREGQAAGQAQAEAALRPVLERLASGIQEIAGLRPQLMREAAAELVELSLAIARRILHRELSVDPAALEGLVGVALQKLPAQGICGIRLHPELEPGVRQALAREGRGGLPLVADGTLERGAILIETAHGKLDASLETQLAEIGRGLADRLPEK